MNNRELDSRIAALEALWVDIEVLRLRGAIATAELNALLENQTVMSDLIRRRSNDDE